MQRLLNRLRFAIRRKVSRTSYQVTEKFNEEVEEIIYRTIASKQIEEIVIIAVERVILSLLKRYWLLIVILTFVLLGLQAIFLSIALTALRDFKY